MRNFGQTKGHVNEVHFQVFLSLLSDNKEEAAEKYELLRMKLFSFFRWNGAETPEDLADQTIDRVLEQIANGAVIQKLYGYIFTTAEHLLHEADAKKRKLKEAISEIYSRNEYSIEGSAEAEISFHQKSNCLETCLSRLSSAEASLILRYYQYAGSDKIKNRKKIAEESGIPLNALRIRACRIRLKLLGCMRKCLENSSSDRNTF